MPVIGKIMPVIGNFGEHMCVMARKCGQEMWPGNVPRNVPHEVPFSLNFVCQESENVLQAMLD